MRYFELSNVLCSGCVGVRDRLESSLQAGCDVRRRTAVGSIGARHASEHGGSIERVRKTRDVIPILVDERRLAAGLDAALTAHCAAGSCEIVTPAALLERLTGVRVIGDAERRAIVRRIAATRDDTGVAPHVSASASFAARVIAAMDGSGQRVPFEAIVDHYRTLLAFANVLDIPTALDRALAGERRPIEPSALRIDAVVLAGNDDRSFAWRRLCAAAGITLETVDLGPIAEPIVDPHIVGAVWTILAYAQSESDADARCALVSRISGVAEDDAAALLTAGAPRTPLLETIENGKITFSPAARYSAAAFARGLRRVADAYCAPQAAASSVLAALAAGFLLEHEPTVAALVRVTRDFDRARTLGPHWEAATLVAEFEAEFASAHAPHRGPIAIGPAPAAQPQSPRPVSVRRLHFSASSLNAYAECPRKWFYRYVCAAVEDRGSSASFYGTAFHAALEEFHLRYARVNAADGPELQAFLDSCIVTAFERYRGRFDAPVEYELQRRRARRTAIRYLTWLLARARSEPFEVIGCEAATELDLDGHAFVGYIDRLDRDDRTGAITVVDYKTGSIATSAEQYRADVATFHEFQLPFYYWARTAAGDRVSKLALIPLKDALLDVAPIELHITPLERPATNPNAWRNEATVGTISIPELERARVKMIEYAQLLSSSTLTHYPATDDPSACRYCAYADGCRERPLVAQERFGR